ncbi:PhnE/PtxC family ABC transporter permease [Roseateles sp. GG27B]
MGADVLPGSARSMALRGEFFPPDVSQPFLGRVAWATLETLAMSALGTLLAVLFGIALALPAARLHDDDAAWARRPTRWLLNALRSIPELVWATLLLIGRAGPVRWHAGAAIHTTGVLGRLFAAAIENNAAGPGFALRVQGAGSLRIFLYATLPQVLPQLISYSLYRWENNIRAAAVLGVVGAGGLGQMLAFHMGLFQMHKTATVLAAMLLLLVLVDFLSDRLRRALA